MRISRRLKVTGVGLFALVFVSGGALLALQAAPPEGPVTPTGQTALDTNWTKVKVVDGLDRPWAAAWLPGGSELLITERGGQLRVVEDGKLRDMPVKGVPPVAAVGQGGLLDVKLHPDFADNRLVYLTAATGTRNANRTSVFRGVLNEPMTELTDVEEIYRVSRDKAGGQHFGSVMTWLQDGSLLVSIGDGGNPPVKLDGKFIREQAQNKSLAFGKVLRMTDDGKPHPDNPYFQGKGDAPYVFTYGHRNVQGIAVRPGTAGPAEYQPGTQESAIAGIGEIWATEHGARGGDELNLLKAGGNYGWPKATYSVEYWGPAISDTATLQDAVDPSVVWTPALAPCGLTFYTGDAFPAWQGDLLAGGLVARQIRRIHFNDAGQIDGQTTLQFKERIRWVGMGPDGGLYVLTDSPQGGLYRIDPK